MSSEIDGSWEEMQIHQERDQLTLNVAVNFVDFEIFTLIENLDIRNILVFFNGFIGIAVVFQFLFVILNCILFFHAHILI